MKKKLLLIPCATLLFCASFSQIRPSSVIEVKAEGEEETSIVTEEKSAPIEETSSEGELTPEETESIVDDKIMELLSWFDKYDMQVKQAERASRLGEEANIHINDKVYKSIKELDSEANEKAKELKILRQK